MSASPRRANRRPKPSARPLPRRVSLVPVPPKGRVALRGLARSDDWAGHPDRQWRIAAVVDHAGIGNLLMVAGDARMIAIHDGANSGYGPDGCGFPVLHARALHRPGSATGRPYSHGTHPGGGLLGTLTVHDTGGSVVTVELASHDWTGQTLLSHAFTATTTPGQGRAP